ncbi:MAG: hypothetical protein IJP07_07530, partial [Firmicutes bacterium]|nr:hypothetical protein [Bacillota bacterium]
MSCGGVSKALPLMRMGKGKASDCHCEEVFAAEIYNISQQNDVANLSVSRRSRETFQKGAVATG